MYVFPVDVIAGVIVPTKQQALFIQMQLCNKDSLKLWLETNVVTRSRKTIVSFFDQVGCPLLHFTVGRVGPIANSHLLFLNADPGCCTLSP